MGSVWRAVAPVSVARRRGMLAIQRAPSPSRYARRERSTVHRQRAPADATAEAASAGRRLRGCARRCDRVGRRVPAVPRRDRPALEGVRVPARGRPRGGHRRDRARGRRLGVRLRGLQLLLHPTVRDVRDHRAGARRRAVRLPRPVRPDLDPPRAGQRAGRGGGVPRTGAANAAGPVARARGPRAGRRRVPRDRLDRGLRVRVRVGGHVRPGCRRRPGPLGAGDGGRAVRRDPTGVGSALAGTAPRAAPAQHRLPQRRAPRPPWTPHAPVGSGEPDPASLRRPARARARARPAAPDGDRSRGLSTVGAAPADAARGGLARPPEPAGGHQGERHRPARRGRPAHERRPARGARGDRPRERAAQRAHREPAGHVPDRSRGLACAAGDGRRRRRRVLRAFGTWLVCGRRYGSGAWWATASWFAPIRSSSIAC